jgi:excisionase family DNA binding protein
MTVREVAALAGCSGETVRRAVRLGFLPARRFGAGRGRLLILRADAHEFAEGADARDYFTKRSEGSAA